MPAKPIKVIGLRALKKLERRAVKRLIRAHGYKPRDFDKSYGEETVCAPSNMNPKFKHGGFLDPGPLKGTPLMWCAAEDGGDYELPSVILRQIEQYARYVQTEDEWTEQTLMNS